MEDGLRDLTYAVQPRQRMDRHPYQVGVLTGMIAVSLSQMIVGLPPQSALWQAVDRSTIITLNSCFVVGAMLGLVAAILPRDHDPRLSLRLGMCGQAAVFLATISYVAVVLSITEAPYWLSVLSAGIGIGVCYASSHRIVQQRAALRDVKRVVDTIHKLEA
jgi:hypothetical protein